MSTNRVDIEKLYRIKLSHLRALLDAAKPYRKLPQEQIKGKGCSYKISYSRGEDTFPLEVIFYFKPVVDFAKDTERIEERLIFKWETPTGEAKRKEVELLSKESNLGGGYRVYYFGDFAGGAYRTLYSDKYGIYNREQLKGLVKYRTQYESRKYRHLAKYQRAEDMLSSSYGRHLYWKGNLTPIAKRLLKAKEVVEAEPDIILSLMDKKRGRKPHSEPINIAIY